MTPANRQTGAVTQQRAAWWVACRVLLILPLALLAGCGALPFHNGEVAFSFDNRTGLILCEYPSSPDAAAGGCVAQVKAHTTTKWTLGCASGTQKEVDRAPVTLILTVKESGRQIYNRTASCKQWSATDRKFGIEQHGDEFIVTDSLPDLTSDPQQGD